MRELFTIYRIVRADWRLLLVAGLALLGIWGFFSVSDQMDRRAYAALSEIGAPEPVTYSAFKALDTGEARTEVNISGLAAPDRAEIIEYRSDGRVLTRTLYFPIFEPGAPADNVTTLIVVPVGRSEALTRMLGAGGPGGEVTVNGMRAPARDVPKLEAAFAKTGLTLDPDALFITPFLDGREAYFASKAKTSSFSIFLLIGAFLTALGLAKLGRQLSRKYLPRPGQHANPFVLAISKTNGYSYRELSRPVTAVLFGAILLVAAMLIRDESLMILSQVVMVPVFVVLAIYMTVAQPFRALVTPAHQMARQPQQHPAPREPKTRFNLDNVVIPPPPTAEEQRQEEKRLRPGPRPVPPKVVSKPSGEFADSPIKTTKGWFR